MDTPRKRGRPRRTPDQLVTWTPPSGWSRLVAWISPEERIALKLVAAKADTSVADLIRGLAKGLADGLISADEVLTPARKGMAVMEKIPTIFERDDKFRVVDKIKPGCEWVFEGQGVSTEKLDGMNVRLTVRSGQLVRVEKRRNPSAKQKQLGIVDGWYVDADEFGPEDRWLYDAARNTDVAGWPDGEHSCEALGPSIQGNPLQLSKHQCVPFNLVVPTYEDAPRTYEGLRLWLEKMESRFSPGHLAEGIVFHHPDGRRAKIKRRDFYRGSPKPVPVS